LNCSSREIHALARHDFREEVESMRVLARVGKLKDAALDRGLALVSRSGLASDSETPVSRPDHGRAGDASGPGRGNGNR